MAFRSTDDSGPVGSGPVARLAGPQEDRKTTRGHLADGTIACPACDAPVALRPGPQAPSAPLECPFCAHAGAVRDFLSLEAPARPAHVTVRVVVPGLRVR